MPKSQSKIVKSVSQLSTRIQILVGSHGLLRWRRHRSKRQARLEGIGGVIVGALQPIAPAGCRSPLRRMK